jgi:hypothetical protein
VGGHQEVAGNPISNVIERLFRWTPRDPELAKYLEGREIERRQIDARIQEIAQASLDSEDGWIREAIKREPACVLEAAVKCIQDPKA